MLDNRQAIYSAPGLEGVSENSGNRINQRVQQMLTKMCNQYADVSGNIVKDAVQATTGRSRKRKTSNDGDGGGGGRGSGSGGGSGSGRGRGRAKAPRVKEESSEPEGDELEGYESQ